MNSLFIAKYDIAEQSLGSIKDQICPGLDTSAAEQVLSKRLFLTTKFAFLLKIL